MWIGGIITAKQVSCRGWQAMRGGARRSKLFLMIQSVNIVCSQKVVLYVYTCTYTKKFEVELDPKP